VNFSACIEMLFKPESDNFVRRLYLAAEGGLGAVEFWGWRNKDIPGIEQALVDTGLTLTSFLSEPAGRLVDPSTHDTFIEGLEASLKLADRLGAKGLIVLSGDALASVSRAKQHQAVVNALRRAAPLAECAGVTLLLEPLNSRVDHHGYYLDTTKEGLEVIDDIGSPNVKLLYDMYHSVVMGEEPSEVLVDHVAKIGHVHIADVPGRHEPGTGKIDFKKELDWLKVQGYDDFIGLEYLPSQATMVTLAALSALTGAR
jgi:hydroxypyruvate isomerase